MSNNNFAEPDPEPTVGPVLHVTAEAVVTHPDGTED